MTERDTEGGDALIHLRVPAAQKARWVRKSRAAGMKLTDWIVNRVEARTMNVHKIPEALAGKYHGSGHALVGVAGGQMIDLVYLKDVLPDFDAQAPGALVKALADDRLGPTVRQLQALGHVSVCMLSCWEAVEL